MLESNGGFIEVHSTLKRATSPTIEMEKRWTVPPLLLTLLWPSPLTKMKSDGSFHLLPSTTS